MSTVTLDDMRSKLLTVDQVATLLGKTEPLGSALLTSESKIKFNLQPGWTDELDKVGPTEPVQAFVSVNGKEYQMTKEAALAAGAQFGLTGAYARKTPAPLIESHLDYWYTGGMGDKQFNALTVGDQIAAFVRPTLTPFSNLSLLEQAVEGIERRYGDTEILADYKIQNTLQRTDVRLVLPEQQRTITGHGMIDVPNGQADLWSPGVHITNSLIGKSQTAAEAYLFRWWCTNGATSLLDSVGTWSRRSDGQGDDVYVWAAQAVDEVLGGMEHKFEEIQALTSLNVAGNTADILREIFDSYEVPVSQRETVTATLLEAETLTLYTIMNAITSAANGTDISPERADRLMRIGGALPTKTFDTLKAKVWAEGHTADPTAANPYAIA